MEVLYLILLEKHAILEKIITRYNSRLMSLSKTKATRRSPCYGEERLFLAFLNFDYEKATLVIYGNMFGSDARFAIM